MGAPFLPRLASLGKKGRSGARETDASQNKDREFRTVGVLFVLASGG